VPNCTKNFTFIGLDIESRPSRWEVGC
jgi:hypothetical protein